MSLSQVQNLKLAMLSIILTNIKVSKRHPIVAIIVTKMNLT